MPPLRAHTHTQTPGPIERRDHGGGAFEARLSRAFLQFVCIVFDPSLGYLQHAAVPPHLAKLSDCIYTRAIPLALHAHTDHLIPNLVGSQHLPPSLTSANRNI